MIITEKEDNVQVDDTITLAGLQRKRESLAQQVDKKAEELESLKFQLNQIDGTIPLFRNEKQGQLKGVMEKAQKPVGKETITQFIRGIFKSEPARWFSVKEIVAQVRLGDRSGLLEIISDNHLASTHNALRRLSKPGKELKTKGERQEKRYKWKT